MLATESLTRRFLFVLISQHVLRPNRVARKGVPPHQLCTSPLPPSPSACFYAGPAIFFYFYVKDDGERPINCDIIQIWAPAPQICCKMKKACYFRSNSNRQNVLNKDIEISKNKENAGIPTTTQNVNVTIPVVASSFSRRQVWPESNRKFYCYHFLSKLRIIIIIILKTAQPTARALVQHHPRLHLGTPVHRE